MDHADVLERIEAAVAGPGGLMRLGSDPSPEASAVREHEALVRRRQYGIRPQDQALYRRLRQICGELDA